MKRARAAMAVGAVLWIATGIGHYGLVHLGSLDSADPWLKIDPALLEGLRQAAVDGGALGQTTVHNALIGFSLWISASCLALGVMGMITLAAPRSRRELLAAAAVHAALGAVLWLLASQLFVAPPQVAGALILACYGQACLFLVVNRS